MLSGIALLRRMVLYSSATRQRTELSANSRREYRVVRIDVDRAEFEGIPGDADERQCVLLYKL